MNIFVVNCGSSSIKYQFFKWPSESPVCSGLVERIGANNAAITHKIYRNDTEKVVELELSLPNHDAGMQEVGKLLVDAEIGVIHDPSEIEAVGHRIVHGGESFSQPVVVTPDVKEEIKRLALLAPLHNHAHYVGITVAQNLFKAATHIVVFDTAFHQTMPEKAYRYAVPTAFYKDHGIRVYGFHGTSHQYVSQQALNYLGNPDAKIITLHLGNGASMAAVKAGKCVDTSMGLGPLDGLIMGTRCGNIDASVVFYLVKNLNYSIDEVDNLFNKKSGMLGLTGYGDMRDVTRAVEKHNPDAELAFDMYVYRIKKYIGAYAVAMQGLDAIVFTAGVGENASDVREAVCKDMDFIGISLDSERNKLRSKELREIGSESSSVKVLVVPTNEELVIAKECFEMMERL